MYDLVDDVCDVSEGVLARRTVRGILETVGTGVVVDVLVTDCDDNDDDADVTLRAVFVV